MGCTDLAQQSTVDRDAGCAAPESFSGDLVKVRTAIGYFVTRAWVTEGIRPGICHVAPSRTLAAARRESATAAALVRIARDDEGRYVMKQVHGVQPYESGDPDSGRLWWSEYCAPEPDVPGAAGSGQRHALLAPAVRVEKADSSDSYGDIMVDNRAITRSIRNGWHKPGPPRAGRPAAARVVRPPAASGACKRRMCCRTILTASDETIRLDAVRPDLAQCGRRCGRAVRRVGPRRRWRDRPWAWARHPAPGRLGADRLAGGAGHDRSKAASRLAAHQDASIA